jgi:tryptophan-rich sensory protein
MSSTISRPRHGGWLMLLVFAGGCLLLGSLSGIPVSSNLDTWYAGLQKSALTPPNWTFAVVWPTLYVLMGIAAWLVWRRHGFAGARLALGLFALQLALNLAWTPLFFGLQDVFLGFVWIVPVVIAVAATTIAFWRKSVPAGVLFLPYLAWVLFASIVAYQTWQLNA